MLAPPRWVALRPLPLRPAFARIDALADPAVTFALFCCQSSICCGNPKPTTRIRSRSIPATPVADRSLGFYLERLEEAVAVFGTGIAPTRFQFYFTVVVEKSRATCTTGLASVWVGHASLSHRKLGKRRPRYELLSGMWQEELRA